MSRSRLNWRADWHPAGLLLILFNKAHYLIGVIDLIALYLGSAISITKNSVVVNVNLLSSLKIGSARLYYERVTFVIYLSEEPQISHSLLPP